MRIEVGAPIVTVAFGAARLGAGLYHLPAELKLWPSRPGVPRRSLRFIEVSIGPDTWPTLCGLEGIVYAYNGPLRTRRMCAVCRAAAPGSQLTIDATYSGRAAA